MTKVFKSCGLNCCKCHCSKPGGQEAFFGNKDKISKSRGVWKELIVNNKTYLTMATFHPAYLLRQPDQKKFSWADLKEIKNKIEELKIGI